jgi:hypothetical protein
MEVPTMRLPASLTELGARIYSGNGLRWLRQLVSRLMRRERTTPVAAAPLRSPAPPAQAVPVPSEPPPPEKSFLFEEGPIANRAERRRLERLRRRHDKFVKPKGELPAPCPRASTQEIRSTQPPVKPPAEDGNALTNDEAFLADRHHEGQSGERVLYKEAELYGEFNFRDTILQQLDRYFVYLARMKKGDPDAWGFYRQVGASLLPYVATGSFNRRDKPERERERSSKPMPLSAWFNETRPSFGCFAYGADPETERYEQSSRDKKDKRIRTWVVKFMYFTKYKQPPPTVQTISGGDIYKMTIWWDRPFDPAIKRKYGTPQEFAIFISSDGKKLVALRMIDTKYVRTHAKRGHKWFHVPQRHWHLPEDLVRWAKESGCDDPQNFLVGLFTHSVYLQTMASHVSMVRVAVTKDDMTAVFAINVHRTAYFFQDRDIHLTEGGQRKRVFHIVRPHQRKNGAHIKFHFRGEREFTWAGYKVSITVPGLDHIDISELDIGAIDEEWFEDDEIIGMEQFGTLLSDKMKLPTTHNETGRTYNGGRDKDVKV